MIYKLLFPLKPSDTNISLFLLTARIIFGALFMSHGIQKITQFSELSQAFPDPLRVGSTISLILAIFGELICSLLFISGLLYRLALIPMIFTMIMAFFIIHGNDPFAARELSFVYLIIFVLLFISGPGKYSIDRLIAKKLIKKGK